VPATRANGREGGGWVMTIIPTDADFNQACSRLPGPSWEKLKARAVQAAAERMLSETRAQAKCLMLENQAMTPTQTMEQRVKWHANEDQISALWKQQEELLEIAFPRPTP
jgi:hypothetical protein